MMSAATDSLSDALRPLERVMVGWRKSLHANPELAFLELETSAFVADRLREAGYSVQTGVGGTGVVASMRRGRGTRCIGLRAELDALPIREANEFPHRSRRTGQMHACGHDGHMAMLLGAAHHLSEHGAFDGTVRIIFQPAEEGGAGALRMIEDGILNSSPMDAVFGMHNRPGLPVGTLAFGSGTMMASYDTFAVTFRGPGGHAAQPHLTHDAVLAASQFVVAVQSIVSRSTSPLESAVVSVTSLVGDGGFNVLPDCVKIQGTVRALAPGTRQLCESSLNRIANATAATYDLTVDVDYARRYPSLTNPAALTAWCADVASSVVGVDRIRREIAPTMGAEDFAFFLEKRPGCFCWLGNGAAGPGEHLHGPRYEFNDDSLIIGAAYWVRLVQAYLSDHGDAP